MKRNPLLMILVSLLPIVVLAQLVDPKTFVTPKTSISADQVSPGQKFEVTVIAEIKKGIHLQAHQPADDYLIPTELALEKTDSLTYGEIRYPDPVERKFSFSPRPVLVYEDKLVFRFAVTVTPNAALGQHEIRGSLRYQSCNDKQCYAPARIEIKIPISVTAPGKPDARAPSAPVPKTGTPAATSTQPTPVPILPVATTIDWLPYKPGSFEEARRAGKPVVIDFTADWCIPCKEMEHTTFRDPEVIALSQRLIMLKADLTGETPELGALQKKFNVSGPPTIIYCNRQGKEIWREVSYIDPKTFLGQIKAITEDQNPLPAGGFPARIVRRLEQALGGGQIWFALVLCFLGGLALNLTPCVYPMIGITVSYFGAQTRRGTRKAFGYAVAYFFGIVITYSVLGLVAASTGSLFGSLLQKPVVLIGIAVILVALAMSMFGAYEFQPPQFLMKRVSGLSVTTDYLGVFLLGTVVGIIAAPCIGPIIVALLVFVGQRGDLWIGWWLFFALAVGLGLPYVILGTYSSLISKLPRSGSWMKWIKYFFGVVLIGLALYFVRPLLR